VQVIRLKLRKNSVYYLTAHSSDCYLWSVMKHIVNRIWKIYLFTLSQLFKEIAV